MTGGEMRSGKFVRPKLKGGYAKWSAGRGLGTRPRRGERFVVVDKIACYDMPTV
jgi:hypothetical protein